MPTSAKKSPKRKKESAQEKKVREAQKDIDAALEDESIPSLYFNGFTSALGSGDVMIVLKRASKPVMVLNTSYTVAKTLAQGLGDIIAQLEARTDSSIMTTRDVEKGLKG